MKSRPISARHAARLALTPGTWFFPLLVAALTACNNSGSANVSLGIPATRVATQTPVAAATDTPGPAATETFVVLATVTTGPGATGTPVVAATDTPAPAGTQTPVVAATNTAPATVTISPTAEETTTAESSPTPTPTPPESGGRPDLVPVRIEVIMTPATGCIHDIEEVMLSGEVCVRNQGSAAAGPFEAELRIAATVTVSFPGVDAGAEVCQSSEALTGSVEFSVDPQNQIEESDESNNDATFTVERPELPPFCPTPSS